MRDTPVPTTLEDFLDPNINGKTAEVLVSPRFGGHKFTIGVVPAAVHSAIQGKARKFDKSGKMSFNDLSYTCGVIVEGCKTPNMRDAAAIQKAGVHTPEEYVAKILLPGEMAELQRQILELSGFIDYDILVDQAKN